jgi:hypothetical protein
MQTLRKLIRPIVGLMLLTSVGTACGGYDDGWPYTAYDYPWYYANYGTYTVVRRPIRVVDGWTTRAFRYRPYRGWRIHRHNSPTIEYKATKGNDVVEVSLIPMTDSTRVEVRTRRNGGQVDKEQAKELLGAILQDYNSKKR